MIKNVDDVVRYGYCIGCMSCKGICRKISISETPGKWGFPVPKTKNDCNKCGFCISDCQGILDIYGVDEYYG